MSVEDWMPWLRDVRVYQGEFSVVGPIRSIPLQRRRVARER